MIAFFKSATFAWMIIIIFVACQLVDKRYSKKYAATAPKGAVPTTVAPAPISGATIPEVEKYHYVIFDAAKAVGTSDLSWHSAKQNGVPNQWHLYVKGKSYTPTSAEEANKILVPLGIVLLPGPPPETLTPTKLSKAWDAIVNVFE